MSTATKMFIPLFFTITLVIIISDLYFSYLSDSCLKQQIFGVINVGILLQRNFWLNSIGLTIIGFAIKNDHPYLIKSMTTSMNVLYDVTSFLLCIALIYNYIEHNNCSDNLFNYILARISGSIFTLVKEVYKNKLFR
jgi:hypothetical protein